MAQVKQYLGSLRMAINELEEENSSDIKKQNKRIYQRNYQNTYRKNKIRKEVFFTKTEFSKIQNNALSYGHKLAEHIRNCALAYIAKTPIIQNENELKNLRWEIKKIGTNINQIAYRINKYGKESFDEMKLHEQLQELEKVIEKKFTVTQVSEADVKAYIQHSRLTISQLESLLKDNQDGD